MSRFLFATLGSLGDLHPYIAVARKLNERGHRAVIATAEDYRPDVEAAGVGFVPVRPSLSELGDYRTLITKLFDVRRGPEFLTRELIMPYLHSAYEHLLRASDGADLLISHPLSVTLPLVARRKRLPWVATVLAPMSFMSCYDPPVIPAVTWLQKLRVFGPKPYSFLFGLFKSSVWEWEAPLRAFRSELGMPSSSQMAMFEGQFSPLCNLALFDPQLAKPQPDWPKHMQICGAPIYDGIAQDTNIYDDLERFLANGEPPVVFALGSSAVWVAGDFWDHAISAMRRLRRRAILITGPVVPKNLPKEVRAYPYLPYSKVFPRAAAIVHQAGAGTLALALRSGRPQLIVPVSFDQPDNAQRTAELCLARVLPFKKVTARRLASELAALREQPEYAREARAVAWALSRTDGAARAAEELIACIRTGGHADNKNRLTASIAGSFETPA